MHRINARGLTHISQLYEEQVRSIVLPTENELCLNNTMCRCTSEGADPPLAGAGCRRIELELLPSRGQYGHKGDKDVANVHRYPVGR